MKCYACNRSTTRNYMKRNMCELHYLESNPFRNLSKVKRGVKSTGNNRWNHELRERIKYYDVMSKEELIKIPRLNGR